VGADLEGLGELVPVGEERAEVVGGSFAKVDDVLLESLLHFRELGELLLDVLVVFLFRCAPAKARMCAQWRHTHHDTAALTRLMHRESGHTS
jgi:hypothetical protein